MSGTYAIKRVQLRAAERLAARAMQEERHDEWLALLATCRRLRAEISDTLRRSA